MEHLQGPSLRQALALFAIIRLGWKGMPGTNTIAYYESLQITDRKSFITLGLDVSTGSEYVLKLKFSEKLK